MNGNKLVCHELNSRKSILFENHSKNVSKMNKTVPLLLRSVQCFLVKPPTRTIHNLHRIGTREVVGYGPNGSYGYYDSVVYPMPGIRWKEETPKIAVSFANILLHVKCIAIFFFCFFVGIASPRER